MKIWFLVVLLCGFLMGCTGMAVEVYRQDIVNIEWSPDQRQLAFVYSNFKSDPQEGLTSHSTLWLIDSDGKNLKEVPLAKDRRVERILQWHKANEILMVGFQEFYSVDVKDNTTKTLFGLDLLIQANLYYCFEQNKIVARSVRDRTATDQTNNFSSSILDLETQTVKNLNVIHDNLTPSEAIISSCDPHSNKVFFSNNKTPHDGTKMIYGVGELDYEAGELRQIQWVDKYTVIPEKRETLIPLGWLSPEVILYQKWNDRNGQMLAPLLEFNAQTGVSKESSRFTLAGAYFPIVYSPGWSQVAFVDGDDLVVAKPDGSERKYLLNVVNSLPKGDPEIVFR